MGAHVSVDDALVSGVRRVHRQRVGRREDGVDEHRVGGAGHGVAGEEVDGGAEDLETTECWG